LHLLRCDNMKQVVIIGNGIAGITAARNIRKRSNFKITVISSESPYFFSRTALMYIYMGHMKFDHTKPYEDNFWSKNNIDLVYDHVEQIETDLRVLRMRSKKSVQYDILVIAVGSKPAFFNWPGQELAGVQGLYSLQDLHRMEEDTKGVKHAVIVGGGLIGIEMAEMLRSRNIEVTMLVREKEFWSNVLPLQEAKMISRHIRSHHIGLKLETELKEIQSDGSGKVKSVVTSDNEVIDCEFVGITTGVFPNVEFLKSSAIEVNKGVLVDEFLQTNIPDVYAIGDCVERKYDLPGRRKIEQVWYTGRMMGEVLAQTICGEKTKYEPGPWFNSAKFFEIEYQTYGTIGNQVKENEQDFYWEHPSGVKCVHLVWDKNSDEFVGINSFGIRLRHEVFDRWLRQRKSIQFVVENLHEANFDPEFFSRHEKEIVNEMAAQFPMLHIKALPVF
jgi:NAD(P)H-nitrite reductase large subunit